MVKRVLLVLLVLLLLVSCSSDNNTGNTTNNDNDTNDNTATSNDETEPVSFEEIVVVDNEEAKITLTALDPDNMWGYTVKVLLENKSSEKSYMYSIESASVNGVMITPLFATTVEPGKMANEEINLMDDLISSHLNDEITDIELSFRVYDSEDWLADEVVLETVHIYPLGEDKASVFTRENAATDTVLVDNESLKVVVIKYDEDSFWGYGVDFYIENKTDKDLMVSADGVSVNGLMMDPFWATVVSGQRKSFSTMSWFSTDLDDNNVTDITEIELTLSASDANDFMAAAVYDEVITLTP